MAKKKSKFLSGKHIDPTPIDNKTTLADLVDESFMAYNAARIREACRLFTNKMLEPDVTVGVTLTGALTPAGLGISAIIPLIKAGFIDWIISTGANLYHDTHFGIGLSLHQGDAKMDDRILRDEEVVRIYDIFFDYSVLLDTDEFFRRIIEGEEFQRTMSSAEFHYLCGKYVREREKKLGLENKSLLAVAYEYGVPIYTSSPGDSSIGMNIAAKELQGNKLILNPNLDVNETASIVLAAKRGIIHSGKKSKKPGKSAIFILGGGSPKNFALQTEPQIQEVLGIDEKGHDYFLQITDARSDTGGLCVAEGTLIDTPRDLSIYPKGVPIENLAGKSGFYVYSFDHDEKKITLSEVEKVWKTGDKEVYRLRYGWWSGQRKDKWIEDEILATPEHLIMLTNGSYKPLKALKKGESLKAFSSIENSIENYRSVAVGDKFNSVGRIPAPTKTVTTVPERDEQIAVCSSLSGTERSFAAHVGLHPTLLNLSTSRTQNISREEIRERYVDNHKVISVEPTGVIVSVYDMTVKKTHNFVANGIVVHNSGATPGEAVSWGKVDPDKLPDAVVAYVDSTVALPIITAYSLARHEPREPKRLFERREEFMDLLKNEYEKSTRR
jgi:deoxyhypusine synthase